MKKEAIIWESFILGLLIIVLLASGTWYAGTLQLVKRNALADANNFILDCDLIGSFEGCAATKEVFEVSKEILCGAELRATLSELEHSIKASNNIWTITHLAAEEPLEPRVALDVSVVTLGELELGTEYYASNLRRKIALLFEQGALEKPCTAVEEELKRYAACDLGNAESTLPPVARSMSQSHRENAHQSFLAGNYLKTVMYTTGAVAFQDELAREQYARVTFETDGNVCIQ